MELMKNRRKPYYGRVIDGPFEGEWIESDDPYFVGHFQQQTYALYTGLNAGIQIDRVIYKWLPTYRAWAWWQPVKASQSYDVGSDKICDDCPPVGYSTDKTRCLPCPRRNGVKYK